jgi:hypothetical protein
MAMRCRGNGLILAGVIVTLVGLGVILVRTLALPREWVTVGVGLALVIAGLARRALRGPDGS